MPQPTPTTVQHQCKHLASHGVQFPHSTTLSQRSKTTVITTQYPPLFLQCQLYAVFSTGTANATPTAVDTVVESLVAQGILTRISGGPQTSLQLLMFTKDLERTLISAGCNITEEDAKWLADTSEAVTATELSANNLDPTQLVAAGVLSIASNAITTNSGVEYTVHPPHMGGWLRVLKRAGEWVLKTLNTVTKTTSSSSMEKGELVSRYTKPVPMIGTKVTITTNNNVVRTHFTTKRVGVAKNTGKHNDDSTGPGLDVVRFRGISLDWVLLALLGCGAVEYLSVGVGGGVRLRATGKKPW